jgi:hypothetical protein
MASSILSVTPERTTNTFSLERLLLYSSRLSITHLLTAFRLSWTCLRVDLNGLQATFYTPPWPRHLRAFLPPLSTPDRAKRPQRTAYSVHAGWLREEIG